MKSNGLSATECCFILYGRGHFIKQAGRTQAGGELGGELQDKNPKSRRNKKKKQESDDAEDHSGNKSFSGAGLGQKEVTTKSGGMNKVVPGQRA